MKRLCFSICALAILALPSLAGVTVTSPASGAVVGSPVHYVATASTTTCPSGVASMGIYVHNHLTYTVIGSSLDTDLPLSPGTYGTVVQEWDHCGGSTFTHVNLTVTTSAQPPTTSNATGTTMADLQAKGGWIGYGEFGPAWKICPAPCPGVTFSMNQHIPSPSLSGDSTKFNIGGSHPYADVLWTNALIGQMSTQGVKDKNHTLLQTLHYFTYDAYFYGANLQLAQVLEFDVSEYMKGQTLIWGTQCRIAGGHQWDIWDYNSKWMPTAIPCNPVSNGWNHLVIKFTKTSSNRVLYQSITLNGITHNINQSYAPGPAPNSWWGLTINFQTDGNSKQSPYHVYVDKLNLTYQ